MRSLLLRGWLRRCGGSSLRSVSSRAAFSAGPSVFHRAYRRTLGPALKAARDDNEKQKRSLRRTFAMMLSLITLLLTSCGFHPQGDMPLAPILHQLYVQSSDPYGQFVTIVSQYLKMSHVHLVESPEKATAILYILKEEDTQQLLSVSGTTQTRQYNLSATVSFEVTDPRGNVLLNPQSLSTTRTITIQSNEILGSSNEAAFLYQRMRYALADDLMRRIGSQDATDALSAVKKMKKHHP